MRKERRAGEPEKTKRNFSLRVSATSVPLRYMPLFFGNCAVSVSTQRHALKPPAGQSCHMAAKFQLQQLRL